jgi:MFS family permease
VSGGSAVSGHAGASAITPRARRVAIGVGGAAVLLAALDAYVVVTLLITMAADMDVAVNRLERATPIITGFLLGYVAGMPLLGGLSDKLGRRAVIQISLAGFLIGSAVTAASTEIGDFLQVSPLPILIAGRTLQGLAGGALLPVTMALVADFWAEHRRPVILGTVGAAQELGSVLGPLYGAALAALIGWRGVFWVNVPLILVAMVAVHFALPGRTALAYSAPRPKVDVVGGVLLAVSLGLLTIGLYNPDPEASVLPPNGLMFIGIGAGVFLLFLLWEWRARTKLIDLAGAAKLPFAAVLAASFLAGAALLVTLLDISLLAQGVLGLSDETESAKLLVRFLVALPVGAIIGGLLAPRLGLRSVTVAGFLVSAFAYWLVSSWPVTILSERHNVLGLSLPRLDTDLAIAGLGLGLVIAPLSAAVLRLVPQTQHGVASAGVVVARTMGMLIGFAGLTGWGLHRFHELTATLVPPEYPFLDPTPAKVAAFNEALAVYTTQLSDKLLIQYHEIFFATAMCCLVAAVISLAITNRAVTEPALVEASQAPAPA